MVNGALRDPGEITMCFIPLALNSNTKVCAEGISEYIMDYKNTSENRIPLTVPELLKGYSTWSCSYFVFPATRFVGRMLR